MTLAPPILLMTRPQASSEGFAAALRARGARFELIISPLIDIIHLRTLPDLPEIRGLVFTSVNGVEAWLAAGGTTSLPCWSVGSATAAAARKAGLETCSAEGDADALVGQLLRTRPEGPLLHVRGRHARGDVRARLEEAGLPAHEVVLYEQPERPLNDEACAALRGNRPVVAPVFSARTATLLSGAIVSAPLLVAAMSEAVAKAIAPLHIRYERVAPHPDSGSMLDCTAQLLAQAGTLVARGDRV